MNDVAEAEEPSAPGAHISTSWDSFPVFSSVSMSIVVGFIFNKKKKIRIRTSNLGHAYFGFNLNTDLDIWSTKQIQVHPYSHTLHTLQSVYTIYIVLYAIIFVSLILLHDAVFWYSNLIPSPLATLNDTVFTLTSKI